jgi:hypothetical protein
MFLSHEFFKHLFREIVKAFVSCTSSLTFPSVQYLIIKTKAGFKLGSMYLTRKGAPVRLVYPFSTALTVGDFYFQPRSMNEVSFITSERKTQAQTQMRVRRESVLTNLNTKTAVVRLRQCPLGEGEC